MCRQRRPIPFGSLVKMARKAESAHQFGELQRQATSDFCQAAKVAKLASRAAELGRDDAGALLGMAGIALGFVAEDVETATALVDDALELNPEVLQRHDRAVRRSMSGRERRSGQSRM